MSNLGIASQDSSIDQEKFSPPTVSITSKDELINLCTMIMFTSSAKHAAVNFLQWEYGCFAPISPSTMLGRIPQEEDRGQITKQQVIQSLPDAEISSRFAATCHVLSDFSEDEVFLLQEKNKTHDLNLNTESASQDLSVTKLIEMGRLPPRWLFTEEKIVAAYMKFQKNLLDIEDQIIKRNKDLRYPYEVLMPSKIPVGIAI